MKVLNCNPVSGLIISENLAKIDNFFGQQGSIHDLYNSFRTVQDNKLVGFCVNGITLGLEQGMDLYRCLWLCYLEEHKEFIKEICSYDDFVDDAPQGAINSAANVFRLVKKYGFTGLKTNCKKIMSLLKGGQKLESGDYDNLVKSAKEFVRNRINTCDEEQIMDLAREYEGDYSNYFVRLVRVCYDAWVKASTDALISMQFSKIKRDFYNEFTDSE